MLSSAYDRHTDSEQVTSLEDFDNMIKLLFGYGREWTVILGTVDGLQNCPTKGIKLGKALARSRHTLF